VAAHAVHDEGDRACASIALASGAASAAPATADVSKTGLAVTDTTLRSYSAFAHRHHVDQRDRIVEAEKLAIEQINASGGILGRQIE